MILSRHTWRVQQAVCSFTRRHTRTNRALISTLVAKRHDPLRILFCGADDFSIESLRALNNLQQDPASEIESIEVVCRSGKFVDRGLKTIQDVPIKSFAQSRSLPIHQIDSFKDWSLFKHINLVIAVSFGLLVPASVLEAAKYGGLNVHPSLLPELRGAAPIQHTLLQRKTHTGVTVQTMHPTKFDHGRILAQTPSPGISVSRECTRAELVKLLAPLGADMLCNVVQAGRFVPPIQEVELNMSTKQPSYAPKITPQDREVNWRTYSAEDIIVRDRAIEDLWDTTTYQRCIHGADGPTSDRRTTFHGPWDKISPGAATRGSYSQGYTMLHSEPMRKPAIAFRSADGHVIAPTAATIDGQRKGAGLETLRAGLRKQSRSAR